MRRKLTWLLAVVVLVVWTVCGVAAADTLRVSAIPDEDPQELLRKYKPFTDYIAKEVGVKVKFVPVVDYAATVEGLATEDGLIPLQQAFLEEAALQCGICTPGFLVAAKALLDANPDPSEYEARYWLAGNLCRCTGYDKIIRAVLKAAEA